MPHDLCPVERLESRSVTSKYRQIIEKHEQFTEKEEEQERTQEKKRQRGERCSAGSRQDHVQHTNSRFDRKTWQVYKS